MTWTYKPNHTIELHDGILTIRAFIPSAYPPHEPVHVVYSQGCDGTPEGVAAVIAKFEHHELREWLRFEGVQPDPPHAPGVDPDSGTV